MPSKPEPPKRPSKITVPERANPLARLVFAEMQRQGVTYADLEWKSGVLISTFKAWRTDNSPGLLSIEAALGALGWSLVPVPAFEHLPAEVREGLAELNEKWRGEHPLLHHLLASACLAPVLPPAGQVIEAEPTKVVTRPRRPRESNPFQVSLF